MSAKAIKSIYKGLQKIKKSPNHMFDINPTHNPYEHDLTIIGPNDTIFEQGIFYGKIIYPKNFPYSPPKVYDYKKYIKGYFIQIFIIQVCVVFLFFMKVKMILVMNQMILDGRQLKQ